MVDMPTVQLHPLPGIAMLAADLVPYSPSAFTPPSDQFTGKVADALREHFGNVEAEAFQHDTAQFEPDEREHARLLERVLRGLQNLGTSSAPRPDIANGAREPDR